MDGSKDDGVEKREIDGAWNEGVMQVERLVFLSDGVIWNMQSPQSLLFVTSQLCSPQFEQ